MTVDEIKLVCKCNDCDGCVDEPCQKFFDALKEMTDEEMEKATGNR